MILDKIADLEGMAEGEKLGKQFKILIQRTEISTI